MAYEQRHERRDRQHLQRVPPHDVEMEQAALGAAMLAREATQRVAAMEPEDFYVPGHPVIVDALKRMVAAGVPVDTGTVAAQLREDGQLDSLTGTALTSGGERRQLQGTAYLNALAQGSPVLGNADRYCDTVERLARKRHILGLASDVVESVYARTEVSGIVARLQEAIESDVAGQVSSWEPVNLTAILAGQGETVVPTILQRADGQALLYPGKAHAFIGEPESCKGWLALWACLDVIENGGHVLYVDFEDDARTASDRLLNMGASIDDLLERFHYIQPDEPVDIGATARLKAIFAAWPISLCVIDSVGEGMSLSGLDEKDGMDFRAFKAALADVARRAGAAVVMIDHVVKDPEKRGGYAIGGQAKKAALDVVYELAVIEAFGRDRVGKAKLWCRKDRLGHVRGASLDGKLTAELVMDSRDGGTSVTIELRTPGTTSGRQFRPTNLMAEISAVLAGASGPMSKTTLRAMVRGKNQYKDIALGLLVAEGYITHSTRGYFHVKPFAIAVDNQPEQGSLTPEDDLDDDF